ncbi:MAG: LptF/LptG family permease, partial [Candidatus Omnitrophica bacterium]|nr:LptF/LptG family permease [Candidatus Omnitrophota bacterium]
ILASVCSIFFSCLFTFFFLYTIIDMFSHLDVILKHAVSLDTLLRYYMSYLPIIFTQVAPISCLLAALYTFARMNKDNEIIAMRSSGLSIMRISRIVVIFGLLISLAVFWVNDKLSPKAMLTSRQIQQQMESDSAKAARDKKTPEVIRDFTVYGLNNRLFYINKFYPLSNTMEGITVLEHDEKQELVKKIVASKGVFTDGQWRFYQTISDVYDKNGRITQEHAYIEEEIMPITETPKDFLNQRQHPDYMNISQLKDYIMRLSKSGAVTVIRSLTIDLYQRYTAPFTSFMIVLLSIPFSLKMRKRATGLSSLGVALMVGFLYYILNAVSIALGKAGILPPFICASLTHAAAFTYSLYLIKGLP